MNSVIELSQISDKEYRAVGSKCFALSEMLRNGMNIPDAICINVEAYNIFVASTGLRERILLELNRKSLSDMRWEEIWDASLRIRNMFLKTDIPTELYASLKSAVERKFNGKAVVVRSSAPGEDTSKTSFAGLHESYVNIKGAESILEHIKLVWASLWSDAALLYRKELGLDIEKSSMAVIIQEIIIGEKSGVAFGKSPNDATQTIIEAVYGLNQGLVDGSVEPDRWILDRVTGRIISHTPAQRKKIMIPTPRGVKLELLPLEKENMPPLNFEDIMKVYHLTLKAEELFAAPQDIEWTVRKDILYTLQSRPITTKSKNDISDKRSWYLNLRRSFENLKNLRKKIEGNLIPNMIEEAAHLEKIVLKKLSDRELAGEISHRLNIRDKWVSIYWSEFIPFAHGVRLFGQIYNDTIKPKDPYEFMDILGKTGMKSFERNRRLEELASKIKNNKKLTEKIRNQKYDDFDKIDKNFHKAFNDFIESYSELSWDATLLVKDRDKIVKLLFEMTLKVPKRRRTKDAEWMKNNFLSHFKGENKDFAKKLLELARASYRLRDDDNIYLGRIEGELIAAVEEGKIRIAKRGIKSKEFETIDVIKALKNHNYILHARAKPIFRGKPKIDLKIRARQLIGQPASSGIAVGKAHVILNSNDIFEFKSGEILVCDAIDPNMSFIVPISAGIVERRGGMLIHGAIIAREYGLPCVTGVPNATSLIKSGDQLNIDGYLGIITINRIS